MHGPEHWFGLILAWMIVGFVVYGLWLLLDEVRLWIGRLLQKISSSL